MGFAGFVQNHPGDGLEGLQPAEQPKNTSQAKLADVTNNSQTKGKNTVPFELEDHVQESGCQLFDAAYLATRWS